MKSATPIDKEKNKPQTQHKGKQKPDVQKKGTPNANKNRLFNHDNIPAVHGSQPAYYDGSELMYKKLQASLKQTGDLNHPDTKKSEMDYKKTLSISDLRDYHEIKSGTYIAKSATERLYMAEVIKNNPEILATKNNPTEITKKDATITTVQPPIVASINKPIEAQIKATENVQEKENFKSVSGNFQKTESKEDSKIKKESTNAAQQQSTTIANNKSINVQDKVAETLPTTTVNPNAVPLQNQTNTVNKEQKTENPKADSKNKNEKSQTNNEKELKISIPEKIEPVVAPRLDKAVDSEQSEVAPDSEATLNIVGLVAVAQEFRDQGQEAKTQLEAQKGVIKTLKSKIKEVETEVEKSDSGLQSAEKNVALKENTVALVEKGIVTSIIRQQKVEQEVGIYQKEYDKNKDKANDLNTETANLLGESQKYQDPSEPDSGKLAKKLKELNTNANTIAQAVSQAGTTTQKLSQEAKQAKAENDKTQIDTIAAKKGLLNSKEKLTTDKQKNKKAKAELEELNPKLKQSEAEGKKLKEEANALLLDSYIIETDITKTQKTYYADMATVEGRNSLKQKETEKIEQSPSTLDQVEALLVAFVQLESEEEQTVFLRKINPSERDSLQAKFIELITNYDANEAEKQASIDQNVENSRDAQIGVFNNKRKDALQKPLNLVTKSLKRITGINRLWLSVSIALSGLWNDVTSITWTDVGKFLKSIISPVEWVKAIGSSITGIWTDISNWKGFSEDPVGMILQKAAGIANKVLTIAGVITGILGVLTLAAAVGSFFTLGALAPLAAWLGGATITMGTITFWIGAVALGLNVLNGIKNIYDIHTAKTAEILFKNSGELKSDITNSAMAILAMVGGKASKKGGASVKNLAENHPKTFGKRMFITLKNGVKASLVSIPKKIASVFKKETWLKSFQSFKTAYNKAKSWTGELFEKDKKTQNRTFDQSIFEEQTVPDRMHEQPLVNNNKTTNIVENNKKPFVKDAFDQNGKLKKKVSFSQGEFGYINETDELGRLSKAQTHDLQLSVKDRLPHQAKTPGKIDGDHAGHLFGDRFGGSPQLDNLVSQASNVNLSKFKIIENEWANAIKQGKKVDVEIKINYKQDELRPSNFEVNYKIDGEKFKAFIKN